MEVVIRGGNKKNSCHFTLVYNDLVRRARPVKDLTLELKIPTTSLPKSTETYVRQGLNLAAL
jgi:hypothetical protein